MAQTFFVENSRNSLKTFLLDSQVYRDKNLVGTEIDKAMNICVILFNGYTKVNIDIYAKIKDSDTYKSLIQSPLNENDKYVLDYLIPTDGTNDQQKRITDLYSINNLNNDFKTFDGKVKFN